VTALLRDAGWHVNRKRVERIWRREGLKVPQNINQPDEPKHSPVLNCHMSQII
jgi:transposase InsO family protein